MEFTKAPKSIRIGGKNKIQTGKCVIVSHSPEYSKFDIRVSQEFIDAWRQIERDAQAQPLPDYEWSSLLYNDTFRVKYDTDSMFFNEAREIIEPVIQAGSWCTLIIECVSIYTFNKKNGMTVRVHQGIISSPECML